MPTHTNTINTPEDFKRALKGAKTYDDLNAVMFAAHVSALKDLVATYEAMKGYVGITMLDEAVLDVAKMELTLREAEAEFPFPS